MWTLLWLVWGGCTCNGTQPPEARPNAATTTKSEKATKPEKAGKKPPAPTAKPKRDTGGGADSKPQPAEE